MRSERQLRVKALTGWPRVRRIRQHGPAQGYAWKSLYERAADARPIDAAELRDLALGYAAEGERAEIVRDPIPAGDAPRLPVREADPLRVLADMALRAADPAGRPQSRVDELSDALAAELPALSEAIGRSGHPGWASLRASTEAPAEAAIHGMFAARLTHARRGGRFSRETLAALAPAHLRAAFDGRAAQDVEAALSRLLDVLRGADIPAVADECAASRDDQLVPALEERLLDRTDRSSRFWRGAFFTPPPLAAFLVRAASSLLRDIGLTGIADGAARAIDPSCGADTLLCEAIAAGARPDRTLGADITPGALAAGAVARALLCEERGLDAGGAARLRLDAVTSASDLERAVNAFVGRDGVPVLLCNPPYNQYSPSAFEPASRAAAIHASYLSSMRRRGLDEWPLLDDYVKFLALAEGLSRSRERAVVAAVIRNAFLSSATHVDMRRSLAATFGRLMVLDLHGDPGDRTRDERGRDDDNVFDQGTDVGVCILLGVRSPGAARELLHADLFGGGAAKRAALTRMGVGDVAWRRLDHDAPDMPFAPPAVAR